MFCAFLFCCVVVFVLSVLFVLCVCVDVCFFVLLFLVFLICYCFFAPREARGPNPMGTARLDALTPKIMFVAS